MYLASSFCVSIESVDFVFNTVQLKMTAVTKAETSVQNNNQANNKKEKKYRKQKHTNPQTQMHTQEKRQQKEKAFLRLLLQVVVGIIVFAQTYLHTYMYVVFMCGCVYYFSFIHLSFLFVFCCFPLLTHFVLHTTTVMLMLSLLLQ